MLLNQDDIKILRSFKAIVLKGQFTFSGDAVVQAGSLFKWFNDLEVKLEDAIKKEPPKTIRKELK
jgi:hypothetical protein